MKKAIPPMKTSPSDRAPGWIAVTRGAALGMAALVALNLAEVQVLGTSAVDNWLVSLRPLSETLGVVALAAMIPCLLLYVVRPALPGVLRTVVFLSLLAMCGAWARELMQANAIADPLQRNAALTRPLGLLLINLVIVIGIPGSALLSNQGRSSVFSILFSAILTLAGFPILSIQTEGVPIGGSGAAARAVVVFATAGDAGGELSEAMIDRLTTAMEQLREHPRSVLVLCGSAGDRQLATVAQMRKFVTDGGVQESRIRDDSAGGELQSVLQRVRELPQVRGEPEVVLVSHWYELARLKMLSHRSGLRARLVAAKQQHALFGQNRLVVFEAWLYGRAMVEPAMSFLQDVRVPSEAELEPLELREDKVPEGENPFREVLDGAERDGKGLGGENASGSEPR